MKLEEELFCNRLGEYMYTYSKEIRESINTQIEGTALEILEQIRALIQNQQLDDFAVVEEIVTLFEKYGIHAGFRHDF